MLSTYIAAAMRHAHYEILPEDTCFYAEIAGFQGIYATGITLEACREELLEVLEEWILLSVARHLPLPIVDGIRLAVGTLEEELSLESA
jgi:predicted RNase H-like HicB family nuclease